MKQEDRERSRERDRSRITKRFIVVSFHKTKRQKSTRVPHSRDGREHGCEEFVSVTGE
jgi:hypothetical protein